MSGEVVIEVRVLKTLSEKVKERVMKETKMFHQRVMDSFVTPSLRR
jgi:flagellar biosynthesis chaperone FliJ